LSYENDTPKFWAEHVEILKEREKETVKHEPSKITSARSGWPEPEPGGPYTSHPILWADEAGALWMLRQFSHHGPAWGPLYEHVSVADVSDPVTRAKLLAYLELEAGREISDLEWQCHYWFGLRVLGGNERLVVRKMAWFHRPSGEYRRRS
jgi:hypothetical protein